MQREIKFKIYFGDNKNNVVLIKVFDFNDILLGLHKNDMLLWHKYNILYILQYTGMCDKSGREIYV